jgi:hypothetical protein
MSKSESNTSDGNGNPFANLAALRIDQSFTGSAGVKKHLVTVPVRKPNRQEFVRVRPDANYRISPAAVIELKDDKEMFFVSPNVVPALSGEWRPVSLFTAINRQGVVFLWPVKLPGEDGKTNEWNDSAAAAVEFAMRGWVRVVSNLSLGAYETFEALGEMPEPVWPEEPFEKLLQIAFRQRFVDSEDHEVIVKLRGLN